MNLDLAAGFVTILVIGIFAGVVFDRVAGPSWLAREITSTARAIVTSILVAIAGAFIGFHMGSLFELSPFVMLACAVIGAFAVLWGWRTVG